MRYARNGHPFGLLIAFACLVVLIGSIATPFGCGGGTGSEGDVLFDGGAIDNATINTQLLGDFNMPGSPTINSDTPVTLDKTQTLTNKTLDDVALTGSPTVNGNDVVSRGHNQHAEIWVAAYNAGTEARNAAQYLCDNTADDVQILAACTLLSGLGGGTVRLTHGDFTASSNVLVPANVEIKGSGWGSVVTFDDASAGTVDDDGGLTIGGDNIRITDLKLVLAVGCGTATKRPNLIYTAKAARSHITIKNVWLVGNQPVGNDNSVVRQNGIVARGTYWTIENCRSDDNYHNGILFYLAFYSRASGNICVSNTNQGIMVYESDQIVVDGNTVRASGDHGIFLYHADWNTIANNAVYNSVGNQIYIWRGIHNVLSQNISKNSAQDGITLRGDSTEDCDYNLVVANNSGSNTYKGLRVIGGSYADGNVVRSNIFIGNTTAPVDSGSNTVIAGNIGWVTVNSGTAAGVGTVQGISHGLGVKPDVSDIKLTMLTTGTPAWVPFVVSGSRPTSTKFWCAAPNGEAFIWVADTE